MNNNKPKSSREPSSPKQPSHGLLTGALVCLVLAGALAGAAAIGGAAGDAAGKEAPARSAAAAEVAVAEAPEPRKLDPELAAAMERNPDAVGWLRLEGCDIDDPVLQGSDNITYLRRTIDLEYDVWGCYFLDYENDAASLSAGDRVAVIYGHSLGDDPESERFSKLKRLGDRGFALENKELTLATGEGLLSYEIFTVCRLPVWVNYLDPNPDDAGFRALLDILEQYDTAELGNRASADDRLLLLSTCTADENTRFVVCAKLTGCS